VGLFTQIFEQDPTNLWAYTNLVNYHLHVTKDMDRALSVAQLALYSNTQNEKIFYDLALVSFNHGDYTAAAEYTQRCLALNNEMSVAYDLLSEIAEHQHGDWEQVLRWRIKALALAPGSPGYNLDVALALAQLGRRAEAATHYARARRLYPEITRFEEQCAKLEELIGDTLPAQAAAGA
jgi:tetratricopeptide (TPR) repeat protein